MAQLIWKAVKVSVDLFAFPFYNFELWHHSGGGFEAGSLGCNLKGAQVVKLLRKVIERMMNHVSPRFQILCCDSTWILFDRNIHFLHCLWKMLSFIGELRQCETPCWNLRFSCGLAVFIEVSKQFWVADRLLGILLTDTVQPVHALKRYHIQYWWMLSSHPNCLAGWIVYQVLLILEFHSHPAQFIWQSIPVSTNISTTPTYHEHLSQFMN